MNNFKLATSQKGAALIVSLMMLVVMTLLALSAVTTTTMEEKMAGSTINKHLSFQSAEAAIRAAETVVEGLAEDTAYDGTNGVYSRSQYGDTNFPIWEWDGTPAINWQAITSVPTGGAVQPVQAPEYIIEDFGTSYRDEDCVLIVPLPPGCELPVFRVTARGWGLNTNSFSMIQSTYKQL